jgi:hypothetical protein
VGEKNLVGGRYRLPGRLRSGGPAEVIAGTALRSVLHSSGQLPPWRALRLTQALLDSLASSDDAEVTYQQGEHAPADARSHIYSAGSFLYELLTGRPPFPGGSSRRIVDQHLFGPPLPPSEFNREVSGEIDAIALRALAKDPADRYQSACEMTADIRDLLTRTALGVRVDGSNTGGFVRVTPSVEAAVRQIVRVQPRPSASPRSSPRRVSLAVAGIAVLLSPVGILDLRDSPQPGVTAVGADLPGVTAGRESLSSPSWLDWRADTLVAGKGGAKDGSARTPAASVQESATGSTRVGRTRAGTTAKSVYRKQPAAKVSSSKPPLKTVTASRPTLAVKPVKVGTPKLTVKPVGISTRKLALNPVKISTPKLVVSSVRISNPKLALKPVRISTPKLTVNPVKVSTPKLTVNPARVSAPKVTGTSTTVTTKAVTTAVGSGLRSKLGSLLARPH